MSDPASFIKSRSQVVQFPLCQLWICEEKVILDSQIVIPDLPLREFARPKIWYEERAYYVSEKSQSSQKPITYRYVLTPWPANDTSTTRQVLLDRDFFESIVAGRRQRTVERVAFKLLAPFYLFLGFLWSRPKRCLNSFGFESHAISSVSIYSGFMLGVLCFVFLVILQWGARTFSYSLFFIAIGMVLDSAMRYHRLLEARDEVPPGFYEWLLRPRQMYE